MDTAAVAFQRARKLLTEARAPYLGSATLALVEVLLSVCLVVVAGLVTDLLISRGVTHIVPGTPVPAWILSSVPDPLNTPVWLPNTGLTGLIVDNTSPHSSYLHRACTALLRPFVARFNPLQHNLGALVSLLVLGLVLLLLLLVVHRTRKRIAMRLAVEAASGLRRQIHRQLYRLGQSALPNEGVGPVLNLFTREVNDIRDNLATEIDRGIALPALAIGLALVALATSWPMTIFLGSLLGLGYLGCQPLVRKGRRDAGVAARDAAVQLCLLHEDLNLVRTVRVYGMEGVDKDRFDEHLTQYDQADLERMHSEGGIQPSLLLVLGAALTGALAVVGIVVLAPEESRLALAAVLVIAGALAALVIIARQLGELSRRRRVASRSAAAVWDYIDLRPELTMSVGAKFLPPLKSRITLEHVNVADPRDRALLTGVSAEIKAGTRCAVLGTDESSCEALVCLLPRLLDPKEGRVRIDGQDLRDVTLESLRAQVATVLQNDLLFSDSVSANIGLGDPSFSLPRIIQAAKLTHAHNFIQNLPHGYDTVIGPLGQYLRPDEQYRIALARAHLHDPSILIIEEPAAQLDDQIKALIDDTIDRLSQNRTLIILPRRLSTLKRCDQVILLNDDRLEAVGPPRQLLRDNKLYRHLQYVNFNRFATGEAEVGTMDA